MNLWIIAIIIGLLVVAGIIVASLTLANEPEKVACENCQEKCNQERNCGFESCRAVNGEKCNCGR